MLRATEQITGTTTADGISIHALHAESDLREKQYLQHADISIHALHAESDECMRKIRMHTLAFQSTLSVQRATPLRRHGRTAAAISIHALRAESDEPAVVYDMTDEQFQSTLSMRRATGVSVLSPSD